MKSFSGNVLQLSVIYRQLQKYEILVEVGRWFWKADSILFLCWKDSPLETFAVPHLIFVLFLRLFGLLPLPTWLFVFRFRVLVIFITETSSLLSIFFLLPCRSVLPERTTNNTIRNHLKISISVCRIFVKLIDVIELPIGLDISFILKNSFRRYVIERTHQLFWILSLCEE